MISVIKVTGIVVDKSKKPLQFAKVIWTDKDGEPVSNNGKNIAVLTSEDGSFSIPIPAMNVAGVNIPASPYLSAELDGYSIETIKFSSIESNKFVLAKSVNGQGQKCKTLKCAWKNKKSTFVIGIISLVILAVIITVISRQETT